MHNKQGVQGQQRRTFFTTEIQPSLLGILSHVRRALLPCGAHIVKHHMLVPASALPDFLHVAQRVASEKANGLQHALQSWQEVFRMLFTELRGQLTDAMSPRFVAVQYHQAQKVLQ